MRDDAHQTSESDAGLRASGAPALPDVVLLRAAERALMTLGREVNGLQVMWTIAARAILLQEEPTPALFIKVYREGTPLAREVAMLERALAAGIPVAKRLTFHPGPPAVLITERVGGIPLTSAYPLAAKATGRLLRRFHSLGASPPFVDGQRSWSVFIRDWADREIATMVARRALRPGDGQRLQRHFAALDTVLSARPCALIHADLQAEHVLIDPVTQRVHALLDFVDTQPGDPLIDIAVLSLWDTGLAGAVLAGYDAMENEQADLLRTYRVLRHLGAANWLTTHGVPAEATRHEHAVHHYLSDLPS